MLQNLRRICRNSFSLEFVQIFQTFWRAPSHLGVAQRLFDALGEESGGVSAYKTLQISWQGRGIKKSVKYLLNDVSAAILPNNFEILHQNKAI